MKMAGYLELDSYLKYLGESKVLQYFANMIHN